MIKWKVRSKLASDIKEEKKNVKVNLNLAVVGSYSCPPPGTLFKNPSASLLAGSCKQRNERRTVFCCWGGRGPDPSVLASFPQGWDLDVRQIHVLWHRSGRRWPDLETNCEFFVPQIC